jgi:hypothetical protein
MLERIVKILAINPGSKYLGVAIFQGLELKDWGVKIIKGKGLKAKMEKVKKEIFFLIDCWRPNVLAIKLLHPSRSSETLNEIVKKIKQIGRRKGLRIYQYSIKELEDFFSSKERINKQELAEILVSKYPELLSEYEKERNHKNPYHIRMFEAVALGSVCSHKLGN